MFATRCTKSFCSDDASFIATMVTMIPVMYWVAIFITLLDLYDWPEVRAALVPPYSAVGHAIVALSGDTVLFAFFALTWPAFLTVATWVFVYAACYILYLVSRWRALTT